MLDCLSNCIYSIQILIVTIWVILCDLLMTFWQRARQREIIDLALVHDDIEIAAWSQLDNKLVTMDHDNRKCSCKSHEEAFSFPVRHLTIKKSLLVFTIIYLIFFIELYSLSNLLTRPKARLST